MKLKVIKILETEDKAKYLAKISGYCLLDLIANKIIYDMVKLDDDFIINSEFSAYDYNKEDKRFSNKQYIECADKFVESLK